MTTRALVLEAPEQVSVGSLAAAQAVTVALKNPPAGATKWQMAVIDWDITEIQSWGTKEQDNIGESAVFDIPPEWSFPLRIMVGIYQKLDDTSRVLYYVQSYRPIKPFTEDEPDPDYKEIFIPGPGSYDYNVATEQFELIAAPPVPSSIAIDAPDSAQEGETVNVSATITNVSAYNNSYKTEIFAGVDLIFSAEDSIASGASKTYGASFIMPVIDVTILVWVERWVGYWGYDNAASRTVILAPELVGWVVLAEEQISISIPEVVGWVALAEGEITITIPEVVAWVQLAEEQIAIGIPPEIIGWVVLAEEQINIGIPPEIVGWVALAEEEITINLTAPPVGEYELVQHTIYPWSYTFEGDAETCVFEFKLTPEQIPGTEWLGERIVDSFVSELEKEGARLLELKVERDTTPVLWTNYRVEITATASPLAWNLIIIGALAILFIVAIYFTIKLVDEVFFKRKALDEETKKTFARETLTAMILDLEPETPPETLEEKSDQELRDLLNQILAEKAPPVAWLPLVIVGGLGILGVGGLLALTARKE